jgi:8-oxo-dGTP pyrophosphatase MutT (NUDIX family)
VKRPKSGRRQFAALPLRVSDAGDVEIMLITSRETRRWVIPKGWPMKGRTPGQAAMVEAYEEAGLEGEIVRAAKLGSYSYLKVQPDGENREVKVHVFPMLVRRQLETWPEFAERETRWFAVVDAASLVTEPRLAKLIAKVPALVRRGKLEGPGKP